MHFTQLLYVETEEADWDLYCAFTEEADHYLHSKERIEEIRREVNECLDRRLMKLNTGIPSV